MEKIIHGCLDCPCCNLHIDGDLYCDMHMGYGDRRITDGDEGLPIPPDWCPLKTEPITLTLKLIQP
jgi:hypothetical protein